MATTAPNDNTTILELFSSRKVNVRKPNRKESVYHWIMWGLLLPVTPVFFTSVLSASFQQDHRFIFELRELLIVTLVMAASGLAKVVTVDTPRDKALLYSFFKFASCLSIIFSALLLGGVGLAEITKSFQPTTICFYTSILFGLSTAFIGGCCVSAAADASLWEII